MFDWLDGDPAPPPSDRHHFAVVDVDSGDPAAVTVRVVGDLDLVTAPRLAAHLQSRIAAGPGCSRMVIDLSGCGFLGSKGVAVLMTAAQEAATRGCTLTVTGCQPIILRVLDITGVRKLLNVAPRVPDIREG